MVVQSSYSVPCCFSNINLANTDATRSCLWFARAKLGRLWRPVAWAEAAEAKTPLWAVLQSDMVMDIDYSNAVSVACQRVKLCQCSTLIRIRTRNANDYSRCRLDLEIQGNS